MRSLFGYTELLKQNFVPQRRLSYGVENQLHSPVTATTAKH